MSRLSYACMAMLLAMAAPVSAQTQPASEPAAPSQAAPAAPAAPTPAAQPPVSQAPAAPTAAPALPDAAEPAPASRAAAMLPHNLSPWGMFMGADIVVKAVMVGLAFASLLTWTIAIAKSLELLAAQRRAVSALAKINGSRSLNEASAVESTRSDAAAMVSAARTELEFSAGAIGHADDDGVKERVTSRLARLEAGAGRRMMRGTGLLATIGSTAPFVGLFGTVWGIMNSFIGISESQTTNLAIVAPGIAEALLATAIGLVAAIPAVVVYNMFARAIAGYRQILADTAAAIERLVSRDLDFRHAPRVRAAAE